MSYDESIEMVIHDHRLGQQFSLPDYERILDAGIDLRAMVDETFVLDPGESQLVPSGFAVNLPDRLYGSIVPRSGAGHKRGLVVGNLTGIIDPDYTGEIMISVWNRNPANEQDNTITIEPGERIAQIIFHEFSRVRLMQVDEFSQISGQRGSQGFGSSGYK